MQGARIKNQQRGEEMYPSTSMDSPSTETAAVQQHMFVWRNTNFGNFYLSKYDQYHHSNT
jgi:hypothetical protein